MEAAEGEVAAVQVPQPSEKVIVLDTTKKVRKPATEAQLKSLAAAREKARLNRLKLKEAIAAAGSLENIVAADGGAAAVETSEPVESGKRAAEPAACDSDVPLAKRTRTDESNDSGSTAVPVPAPKPVSVRKSRAKGKGKEKMEAKKAPLLWMPCVSPQEFGIKIEKPLAVFP
jgi:hypothetical protein